MALPVVMKNNNGLIILALILGIIVLASSAFAQNGMDLVAARKRASELINASIESPPEPCVAADSGEGRGSELYFPEGRADEVYVWDYNGYSYFKIENDKAIIKWRGFALDPEGQVVNQNNSFAKIMSKSYFFDGKPVSVNSQCGELPDFNGRLEVFGVGTTTAYNGIYGADGELVCENILSDKIRHGETPIDQYFYGVARCEDAPK
jgi:hypothetical protein